MSGSWLKLLAIVTMTADHAALFVLRFFPGFMKPLFMIGSHPVSWYVLMRGVGRMAFPLFAFLLVEGFLHTRSRRRYGMGLLLFGLLSMVPWSLACYGCLFTLSTLNIFFTLLLGFLALCAISRWEAGRLGGLRLAVVLVFLMLIARLLHFDYEAPGVGFIIALYALRHQPALRAVVGIAIIPARWKAGLAFIPISLYNGRRGFIKGPIAKYAFYTFYPLHLLLLYFIREVFVV
jgi:hypothetical protein